MGSSVGETMKKLKTEIARDSEPATTWLEFFGPDKDAARHMEVMHPDHKPRHFVTFFGATLQRGITFEITNFIERQPTFDELEKHIKDLGLVQPRPDTEFHGRGFSERTRIHAQYLEDLIRSKEVRP